MKRAYPERTHKNLVKRTYLPRNGYLAAKAFYFSVSAPEVWKQKIWGKEIERKRIQEEG